jgi:hypothetical protein
MLGDDGRVWDGHHRLCVADEIGMREVPVTRDWPDPEAVMLRRTRDRARHNAKVWHDEVLTLRARVAELETELNAEDDVAMSWHNRFHAEFMAHAELRDDLNTLDEPSDIPDGNGRCTSELADVLFNVWAEMPDTTGDYAAGEQLAAAAMTVIRRVLDRHPKPNP